MAKAAKKDETASPVAFDVNTLEGMVSGDVTVKSVQVDEDGEPLDTRTFTVYKGKLDEKVRYVAACDGAQSGAKASLSAAISEVLEKGLLVLPAAWVIPKADGDVRFPVKGDNKPSEPETFEELDAETQAAMKRGMERLVNDYADYRDAEGQAKVAIRNVAVTLRDMRLQYTKKAWGIFVTLAGADSDLAKMLTAKNTLSEFVALAGIPEDLFALVPEGKNSPKAVQAWINGMRGAIAGMVVDVIKADEELAGDGFGNAVKTVLEEHESGENALALEDAAAEMLLGLHWANIRSVERLFDLSAEGSLIPMRVEKAHVTAPLFGTEGADELVKALCAAANSYVSADEKAVTDDMRAKTKALVSNAKAFGAWTADEVARHLFNILSGRIVEESEETLETTTDDALVVLDKMQGWVDAIRAGTMSVADVINPAADAPKTEDDAEADADAEA